MNYKKIVAETLANLESFAEDGVVDMKLHDAQYHPAGWKEGDKCKFRDTLAKYDSSDKLSSTKTDSAAVSFMQKQLAADPTGAHADEYRKAIAQMTGAPLEERLPSDADFDSILAHLNAANNTADNQKLVDAAQEVFDSAESVENLETALEGVSDEDAAKSIKDMLEEEEKNLQAAVKKLNAEVSAISKKMNASSPVTASNNSPATVGPNKPYIHDPSAFPQKLDSFTPIPGSDDATVVFDGKTYTFKGAGGSTGVVSGEVIVNGKKKRLFIKHTSSMLTPEALDNEMMTNSLMRAAGLRVPDEQKYQVGGVSYKVSEGIPDVLGEYKTVMSGNVSQANRDKVMAQMREAYPMLAFTLNSDLNQHNIIIDKNFNCWFPDNGAAFMYRGRGDLKDSRYSINHGCKKPWTGGDFLKRNNGAFGAVDSDGNLCGIDALYNKNKNFPTYCGTFSKQDMLKEAAKYDFSALAAMIPKGTGKTDQGIPVEAGDVPSIMAWAKSLDAETGRHGSAKNNSSKVSDLIADGDDAGKINAALKAKIGHGYVSLENGLDAIIKQRETNMIAASKALAQRTGDPDFDISSPSALQTVQKNWKGTVQKLYKENKLCNVMKPHRFLQFLTSGVFKTKYNSNADRQERLKYSYGVPQGDPHGEDQGVFSTTLLSPKNMFNSTAFGVYGAIAVEWNKNSDLVPCFSSCDYAAAATQSMYGNKNGARDVYNPSLVSAPSICSLGAFEDGFRTTNRLQQAGHGVTLPSGVKVSEQAYALKRLRQGELPTDAWEFDKTVNGADKKSNNGRSFGWNEVQMIGQGTTGKVKAIHIDSNKWKECAAMSPASVGNGQFADANAFVSVLADKNQPYFSELQKNGIQIILDGKNVTPWHPNPSTLVLDEALSEEDVKGVANLEKHDAAYHNGAFNGMEKCKYREKLAKHDDADNIDPENVEEEEIKYGDAKEWEASDRSMYEVSYDTLKEIGNGDPVSDSISEEFAPMIEEGNKKIEAEFGKGWKEILFSKNDKSGIRNILKSRLFEVRQPVLDALYGKAKEMYPVMQKVAAKAAAYAGSVSFNRPNNEDEGFRVKKRGRAFMKTEQWFNGDYGKMCDLIGATITVPDESTVEEVIEGITKNMPEGSAIVRMKKLDQRQWTGYADVKVSLKLPNGIIGELIVVNSRTNDTKSIGGGHTIYEVTREMKDGDDKEGELKSLLNRLSTEAYKRGPNAMTAQEFSSLKDECISKMIQAIENKEVSLSSSGLEALSKIKIIRPPSRDEYRYQKRKGK